MFDDFMEELRRRQAAQRSNPENPGEPGRDEPGKGEPGKDEPDGDAADGPKDSADDEGARGTNGNGGPEPGSERRFGSGPGRGNGGPSPFGDRGFGPPRRIRRVDGGDDIPFRIGRGPTIAIIAVFVVVGLILLLGSSFINLATDAMWFQSVGFSNVFWTRLGWQLGYFALGTVVAAGFLWFNVWLAGRFAPPGPRRSFSLDNIFERFVDRDALQASRGYRGPSESIDLPDLHRPVAIGLAIVAALAALALGGLLGSSWETIQLWLHQVSFGTNEPTFGRDIGFFVFQLPLLRLLQSFANSLVLFALVLAGIRYLLAVLSGSSMGTFARLHVGILVGALLLLTAAGYQLDKLELVYGDHGVFTGVNYADANARFVALDVLTVLAAFAAAFVIGFAYTRWLAPLTITIAIWVVANLGLLGIYPLAIQRFVVDPNTQTQEAPFAQKGINMTRLAFGLDKWVTGATSAANHYNPAPTVTKAALDQETATIDNVRLWDISPLTSSLDQLQVIRPYYSFPDVDTDRYNLSGNVRQVMIAGRQFDEVKYASQSSASVSWVNQHVNYTHGLGVAMVPVSNVGQGGKPDLIIQNLPPVSTAGAPTITEPRIYFGDTSSDYVVVDAKSPEFDLPGSSGTETTYRWQGQTGIHIDNALVRLLFSARFGDFNLLISDQVTTSSQLLFRRSIAERAQLIAPFLRFDKDPYLVVTGSGRLVYVLDGYTVTDHFPSSQNLDPGLNSNSTGLAGDPFNYLRNSVKVVMDAYDGTMTFYVADPTDPMIQAWQSVFPGVFTSFDKMPADIKAHIRYPEDMFNAQTTQYERYHVVDPIQFQQNSDVWSVPSSSDKADSSPIQLGMEAYYVQMRLPNDPNPEFLLLTPMTPKNRQNMISWVAARNDPAHYGQVEVFDFPIDTTTFGPQQLQGLINQNPDISQQVTLWDQAGSRVIMGNLLVIPLQDSLLYIEPVYLQAQNAALPEFERVVVGTPSQVVWGTSLQDALNQILAGKGTTGPNASQSPGPSPSASTTASPSLSPAPGTSGTPLPTNVQALVSEANRHYQLAQEALARGDFATYGAEMNQVRDILKQLEQVVGTPKPAP